MFALFISEIPAGFTSLIVHITPFI
jgi:hypothetical protein